MLCGYSDTVERASIDEAFLDLTQVIEQRIATAGNWRKDKPENKTLNNEANSQEPLNNTEKDFNGESLCTKPNNIDHYSDFYLCHPAIMPSSGVGDVLTADHDETIDFTSSEEFNSHESSLKVAGTSNVLLSLIPSLAELKNTWVKLPDEFDGNLEGEQEEISSEEERLKKYEFDETVPSLWTPNSPCSVAEAAAPGSADETMHGRDPGDAPAMHGRDPGDDPADSVDEQTTQQRDGNY